MENGQLILLILQIHRFSSKINLAIQLFIFSVDDDGLDVQFMKNLMSSKNIQYCYIYLNYSKAKS